MKITFNNLSTKELATLAHRVINSSEGGEYTIVEDHDLLLAIKEEYADYDKVYNKLTYSGKGEKVAAADEARDEIFSNLKGFLKGYRMLPSMPNHADADALYKVLERVGLSIDRLNYAEQTAQMKKLIEKMQVAENSQRIENLNLIFTFNELRIAQAEFEHLYAKQAEANAELRALPSASAIRTNLQIALRNYFKLLSAMKNVPGWEMIYADINEVVKKAGGRKTKRSEDEEEDE